MESSGNLKKRLSIQLLKLLTPVLEEYKGHYSVINTKDSLLSLYDPEPDSDFMFLIKGERSLAGEREVDIYRKPLSSTNLEGGQQSLKTSAISNHLKDWLECIKYYNAPSILDDQILQGYEEEFFQDFKIDESDADQKGFNYDQQKKLDVYLENLLLGLDEIKSENSEQLIEELQTEVKEIKAIVTQETKNGLMRRLSRLWAKGRKGSLKISEFMLKEFAKEFLKESAKRLFVFAAENAPKIPEYIGKLSEGLI